MHHPKPVTPKPAPTSTVAQLRKQPPNDMRSAVLLSLIVCPRGGVNHPRHGQGAGHASR